MKIFHPDAKCIPRLAELWNMSYPDDEQSGYSRFYFESFFSPSRCLALEDEGELRSAGYWFDAVMNVGEGEPIPMRLMYAAATDNAYRRRGYNSALTKCIYDDCVKNGVYAMIMNALPTTRGILESRGATPCFNFTETVIMPDEGERAAASDCGFDEFAELRRRAFGSKPYAVTYDRQTTRYMYEDIRSSGRVLAAELDGQRCYACVTCSDRGALIREASCAPDAAQLLVNTTAAALGTKSAITLRSASDVRPRARGEIACDTVYTGHMLVTIPHPALDNISDKKPYLNLTAD